MRIRHRKMMRRSPVVHRAVMMDVEPALASARSDKQPLAKGKPPWRVIRNVLRREQRKKEYTMASCTMAQRLTHLRQTLRRYARWRTLSLVLVVATFVVYRALPRPAHSAPVGSSTPQTLSVNPAQQDVFDSLWAHRSNQPIQAPTATLNPAQQSVMQYLHAHELVDRTPTLWDQAAQAVRDYLRAHSR